MDDYSIKLGVELDTNNLQQQINRVGENVKPIQIKVDTEAKELTKSINDALKTLSSGTKNALTLDTTKLETSLNDVASTIKEIRTSLSGLDSGAGMKSLLSSINQISTALDKASGKFDELNAELKTLSSKDFSINVGVNMGGSNPIGRNAAYGNKVRNDTLPQLKQQMSDLVKYYNSTYKSSLNEFEALQKMVSGTKLSNGDFFENFLFGKDSVASRMNSGSLASQMQAYKQYIDLFKQAASLKGLDISGVTSGFSKSADDLIKDAQDIQTGANEMQDGFEKLKQVFGGNNLNVEGLSTQLDSIVADLTEIKTSLQGLSSGISVDGLTQSFDKLSNSIEQLVTNAKLVQDVLSNGFSSSINTNTGAIDKIEQVSDDSTAAVVQNEKKKQATYRETANEYEQISKSVSLIRASEDKVNFKESFESSNQAAQEAQRHFQDLLAEEKAVVTVTEQFDSKNSLQSFIVNIKRATGEVESLRYAMSEAENDNRLIYQGGSVNDNNVEKQLEKHIKKANDLQIALDKIKSGYSDIGASKPIKDSNHIEELNKQYDKVKQAIADVKNADNSTFSSMVSNAEKEKATLENMVREFKNAETVATSLRSKDLSTLKVTYDEDLSTLASQMKKAGVYTSDFDTKVGELRTSLSNVDSPKGLVDFLNELDKLKAGFKSAKAAKDEFNSSQNVASAVSSLKSEITILQNASPSIKNFKTQIDGAEVSVESLLNDLKQVKTQGDFKVVENRFNAFGKAVEAAGIDLNEVGTKFERLKSITKDIANLKIDIFKLDDKNDIAKATAELEKLENEASQLRAEFQQGFPNASLEEIDDIAKKGADALAKLQAQFAKGIKTDFDLGNFDNELSSVYEKYGKLRNQNQDLETDIKSVEAALKAMEDAIGTGDEVADVEKLKTAYEEYRNAIQKVNNELAIQQREERAVNAAKKLAQDNASLKLDMQNWLKQNTKAAAAYGEQINKLIASCDKLDAVGNKNTRRTFNNITKDAENAGLTGLKTWDRLVEKVKEYSVYLSAADVFMYTIQGLKSMFEQVKAIDTAMTELKKVTDETDASYNQFLTNAASRAKELGTTIDGLVESTADFARLGYGFEDAQGLAEVANIYAVVGDEVEGVQGATESLISTMAAFKDEANGMSDADFAMSIIDVFNEIGNNFAISSGGLGEALERSASSLKAANNSLHESAALITAANEVVQDPEKVGNALKTVSMRIRSAKSEMEEAGIETDGMVESTAKLREEIMALSGVDIMLDSSTFKSTYQIMDELSAKWKDLSDIAQASIVELMAGKHQGNVFSSLMENFDTAREALETSANSAGSAMQEHEKWSQSLEARLNSLSASWQSLSQSFLSSDFLKVAIDGVTGLVDILDKLIQTIGSFGTIGLGLSIFGVIKNFNAFKDVFSLFQAIPSELRSTKALFQDLGKVATSTISGIAGTVGIAVAAIGLIYNAYKNYKEEQAEARREAIETSNTFLDSANTFEKAYIKYSGRTNLTVEEESELESAINGTVDALGDKTSALQSTVNASNDYVASLEAIANAELRAAKKAAEAKVEAAEGDLKEAAIGWSTINSEVNVDLGYIGARDEAKIAQEMGSNFFNNYADSQGRRKGQFVLSGSADTDEIIAYYNTLVEYQQKLEDAELTDDNIYKNVTKAIESMSEAIETYTSSVYEAAKAQYQLQNGIPKTTEEYLAMREAILNREDIKNLSANTKLTLANSLDSEYKSSFDLTSAAVQARKLVGVLDEYGDNEVGEMETFLNMKTAVNNNECTVGDYLSQLDEIEDMTKDWEDESKEIFNTSFNLDTDTIKSQYDEIIKYVSRNIETPSGMPTSEYANYRKSKLNELGIEDLLSDLTTSELAAVVNIKTEIDWENQDIEDIRQQIEKEAEFLEAMNYTIAIDVETESVESLNTALSESVSATGLSSESIEALKSRYAELASQGYDLSAMFEETSNGIHLNKAAVSELEQAYASSKLTETDEQLGVLKKRYDELTNEIKNCTDAGERAHLYSEQQDVAQKINDLATLASQYKGLTSAYNAWQNVESAGNERDMYENIISGFETIEDEISRGWYDDGTIKFLELMTGETDLAGKSASELKEIWNSLDDTIKGTSYSVKDFFTTNEDGESTSTGAYNFLRAVEELGKNGGLKALEGKNIGELVERNSAGKIVSFDFGVVGGDKAVAEALGVSEEMVQIIQRALDDAGFVVTLDGKYTLLADLKTSAEEANNSLKKLQSEGLKNLKDLDLNFDFNVDTVEGYQEQLEKVLNVLDKFRNEDGTLQTDKNGNLVKGAQEALEIAEYYTAAMDKLTEPKFMQIDTSTVDSELQDPIEKMQEIGDLCKEKHLVSLTGDTKELDKVQGEIDKVAKEIEELDPEVKAKIGIDEDWDAKTIADKIEKGEIEVPAELKLDVQMSDDLKDMRLMMMNQLGLVDDNEVKLKIGYDIDDSTVDKLIKDGKEEIVLEFITKNEKWFKKLSDDKKEIVIDLVSSGVDLSTLDDEKKTIVVEFIADNKEWFDNLSEDRKEIVIDLVSSGVDLDGLDDEKKEVVINYVEENKDLFDSLSDDEKTVVVKYIAEGKDFDKLTDEEKEVIVKLIGDDSELKDYTPEQKEAMVKYLVDGGDVEGWTPEQKEAWAKYLVDHGDIDGWTPEMKQAWAQYLVDGGDVEGWTPEMKEAYAKYIVDGGDVNGYTPEDKKALAKYLVDGGDPANYQPPSKTQNVKAKLDSSEPDDYQPENKSFTVKAILQKVGDWANSLLSGGSKRSVVNGTANANGTAFIGGTTGKAFKRGNWGIKDSGTALVGELGTETLVRDGHYYTIGDAGAEFINYKKGDIIFNHKQTEELFRYGKITSGNGRGKALVGGTAFSSGTGGGEEYNLVTGQSYGSSSSSSSDTDDDFEEVIDWIEVVIDRIERSIDKFEQKANNIYKSWSSRNKALQNQISEVSEEITLQQKAYNKYMEAAAGVGLSSSYVEKVRNGEIDIETITDETLKEKIDSYTEWYNKALDCKDAIEELREEESKLYAQRFENIQSEYDGILQGYEHTETMLNEYINQAEAQGHIVSKKYYEALIANEKSNIAELKKEQSALIEARDEAVASGTITKNSEEWISMCNEIDSVTQAIEESTTALLEFDNAMRDINFEIFDLIQERISGVTEEADFLIELMSNKELFGDDGKLTSQGLATLGLHAQNYNSYMYQADEYGAEVAKLDKQIASDPYDQELINRRSELLELQRESILAAEDEKESIKSLLEEGYEKELEALSDRIDKYNESIDAAKDLYDYQKDVQKQSEEIASLEKQRAAYLNDNSESGKAKLQEIEVSLKEAKEDLEETEYDRYITQQEQLLSTLYDEYELILNQRLDNVDYLLEQVIETINTTAGADGIISSALGSDGALSVAISDNATSIKDTLTSEAKNVGVALSSAMNSIWSVGEGNAKSVLTMYGEDFKTKSTTINTTLNSIKASVNSMVSALNKEATTKITANKTTTSAKKNPTTSSSSSSKKTTTTKKSTSSGDGVPKIGDRVKYVDGIYYYDSQGKKPLGSHNKGNYVYITNINKKSWATHPYHISTGSKLGKGDLGWLKLNQLSGYATGKKNFLDDETAWTQENGQEFIVRPSDGAILTPIAKGDSVLTSTASNNIWDMANSPADFIKDNLNLGTASVPNNSTVQNTISQNFENITFSLPNVKNYSELLSEMQKDKNFERLVLSMSIDQIAGKSKLAKGKSIR